MTEGFELPGLAGLGTAPLGSGPGWELDWGRSDEAGARSVVRAAVGAGVGWIDTAPFYGWGLAERLVGRALRAAGRAVTVLTKCGTRRRDDGAAHEDASPGAVRRGVHESLERIRLDFVDAAQVHDPDPSTPIEDTWSALMELVDEGVIGGAALSNHPVALMERAVAVGPVAVVQHQYSLLHRTPEIDGTLAWCEEHGVAFLAWSPLGSGFLVDGFDLTDPAAGELPALTADDVAALDAASA